MPKREPRSSKGVQFPGEPGAHGAPDAGELATPRRVRGPHAPGSWLHRDPASTGPGLLPGPASRPRPHQAPPLVPAPPQRAVRGGGGAEAGVALRLRARAPRGGASGGAIERLPAVRGVCPAGLRDMKVSPAAAGRGGARVPRPGSCSCSSHGLSSPPRSGRRTARVRAGGAAPGRAGVEEGV